MTRKAISRRPRAEHASKTTQRRGAPSRAPRWWTILGVIALAIGLGGVIYIQTAAAPDVTAASGVLTYHRNSNVYALSLVTKADRQLTDYPPGPAVEYTARAPDGTRLALVHSDAVGQTLSVMDLDSGDSRAVIQESAPYTYLKRPQWTPDAAGLVYTVQDYLVEGAVIRDETFRVEQVKADGSDRRVIASNAQDPTLAPDGTLAFVRHSSGADELMLLAPDGTESVLIPRDRFLSVAAPRFSPDGQRIAFVAVGGAAQRGERPGGLGILLEPAIAYAHGLPWDVWLVDRTGTLKLINRLAEDDPTVTWSPDGRSLAVSGENGVYLIDVAGGRASRIATAGGPGGIDWTP
jgi:Tol biopolymer transport system component